MINLREIVNQNGGWKGVLSRSDWIWDSMTNCPDYYCSSIGDFRGNFNQIRGGRLTLFKSLTYFPINSGGEFELNDLTGKLEARLKTEYDRGESLIERMGSYTGNSPSMQEMLATLNSGDRLYDVTLTIKKGKVYVASFNVKWPEGYDSAREDYFAFRFPQLAPVVASR